MIVTMDSTLVTLDSTTAFTWDQDTVSVTPAGFVDIYVNSTVTRVTGNARLESIAFNRQMLRNPYGGTWFQAGDGSVGPQLLRVTAEVWDETGIVAAATEVEAVRIAAEDSTLVQTPFGEYDVTALQSFSRSPIESGYRVELVFVTTSGRNP